MAAEIGDSRYIAMAQLNLAYCHAMCGNFEMALQIGKSVYDNQWDDCDKRMKAVLCLNLCGMLVDLGRYEEALVYADHGLSLELTHRDPVSLGLMLGNRASALAGVGKDDEAAHVACKAEASYRGCDAEKYFGQACGEVGDVYQRQGRPEKAILYLQKALETSIPKVSLSNRSKTALNLARALESVGDTTKALENYRLSISLSAEERERVIQHSVDEAIREYRAWMAHETELQAQLKSALSEAKSNADLANALKTEFLANLSHEIRTPLNGILGTAKSWLTSGLQSDQEVMVRNLWQAGEELVGTIKDVLTFSEIESGELEVAASSFSISALIDDIRQAFEPDFLEKGIQVTTQISPELTDMVSGDFHRVKHILVNLVSNAINFTTRGGVHISVKPQSDAQGQFVRFSVADTGIGMSLDQQAAFRQNLNSDGTLRVRRYGGAGLKVNLTRCLVQRMGGSLSLESRLGEGTTFSFDLALLPVQVIEPKTDSDLELDRKLSETEPLSGWRILVAEDNEVNWFVLEGLLLRLGAQPTWARDGLEALQLLEESQFDCILMDCHMPRMDGYEATIKIRAMVNSIHASIPIVAVTADGTVENEKHVEESGMNGYLTKPVESGRLVEMLLHLRPLPS